MKATRTISIPKSHGLPVPYSKKGRPEWLAWAMTLAETLEGKRPKVYWDGEDCPKIGVDFRLDGTPKTKQRLASYGVNYQSVYSGKSVPERVVSDIFHKDIQGAVSQAVRWINSFYQLNDARKAAITYICFKHQVNQYKKIPDMIEQENPNWDAIADEMEKNGLARREIAQILRKGEIRDIG